MALSEGLRLLPPRLLEQQLLAIDLLLSMFPADLHQAGSTAEYVRLLQEYLEDPSHAPPASPQAAEYELHMPINPKHDAQLQIQFPMAWANGEIREDIDEPPWPVITFRCPTWMSRKTHADIVQRMPVDSPDSVLMVVEYLKEEIANHLASEASMIAPTLQAASGALVRVWFYLQSLSTRSKRNDMVNWAPNYGLTGFVLAGKPGILCLEGTSENISSYMSDIKTNSWSDVPSHQKKVSERFREGGPQLERVFENMREITGDISKGGHRGNRGEMGEVKKMFEGVGLGQVFAEVLGF
ncbi:hypothetical protein BDV95DRAFT_210636 [Massariosphaeria phaeospora]|uniref:Small nuclear ribonucleoprotein Prp3 C-terminal domain-containing protein n=1 Tax=Massariosphaeria phaeospora TaxID=100035 RepID=A0A7C8M0H9_9PLEO|nr:hypothetical protein BDV95DRAFT_210636 [Massariosphaeria phaeospora]